MPGYFTAGRHEDLSFDLEGDYNRRWLPSGIGDIAPEQAGRRSA